MTVFTLIVVIVRDLSKSSSSRQVPFLKTCKHEAGKGTTHRGLPLSMRGYNQGTRPPPRSRLTFRPFVRDVNTNRTNLLEVCSAAGV